MPTTGRPVRLSMTPTAYRGPGEVFDRWVAGVRTSVRTWSTRQALDQLLRRRDRAAADEAAADVRRGAAVEERPVGQQRHAGTVGLADDHHRARRGVPV